MDTEGAVVLILCLSLVTLILIAAYKAGDRND